MQRFVQSILSSHTCQGYGVSSSFDGQIAGNTCFWFVWSSGNVNLATFWNCTVVHVRLTDEHLAMGGLMNWISPQNLINQSKQGVC